MADKKKLKLIGLITSQILLCVLTSAQTDFIKFSEGQEKCSDVACPEVRGNFIPYSKAFVHDGEFLCLTIPESKKLARANYAESAKIPVKAATFHSIKLTAMGVEQLYVVISGLFFKNGKCIESRSILRHIFLQNVNGMTALEKSFVVPPGVDSMILKIYWTPWRKEQKPSPGRKLIIKELSIKAKNAIKIPEAQYRGKNLLSVSNFKNYPLGEFSEMFKGLGKDARHATGVKADIVEFNGEKCLKIERTPKNYTYPYFTSIPFDFEPNGYLIRASVTVCGKGTFRLGLWWERDDFLRDYMNKVICKLSDEWTTFTETRACLSPLTTKANLSFASTGNAVIYVKDIKLEIIDPINLENDKK